MSWEHRCGLEQESALSWGWHPGSAGHRAGARLRHPGALPCGAVVVGSGGRAAEADRETPINFGFGSTF